MYHTSFLISFIALLFGYSCQSQTPELLIGNGNGLTPVQQEILAHHVGSFPDSTELALALIRGDSVTFVGVRRIADTLQTVDHATRLFEVGSITKVFTAGILAKLVTQGKLRLDEPVRSLLPVQLRQPEREGVAITLRHLANHTSGLPRMPSNFSPANPNNPFADYDQATLYDYLQHQQSLVTTPGVHHAYSNLGFGLLGHILSQQTETSYEVLVQKFITTPLGMHHTFVTVPSAQKNQLVPGRGPDGKVTANWDLNVLAGAGAIKATAQDMAIWLQANMDTSATTYALWKQCQAPTFTISDDLSVGLGWLIADQKGKKVHWHNGGTGGYRSCVAFHTKSGTGVVVLSNVSAFSPHQASIDALCFRILESLYTTL